MAGVAAQQLPQQDAKRYHRWLQDDAVKLQMQEVLGNWDLFQFAPDPMVAKALFVGLCFVRYARQFRNDLDDAVERLRHQPNWITFTSWWTMTKYRITGDDPEDYPFALSDEELDDYCIKNFSKRFAYIRSYHPPSFYAALAEDIIDLVAGVVAARFADVAVPKIKIPAGALLSEQAAAQWAVRTGITKGGSNLAHRMLPGGALDAARKDMLFPRYVLESHRRALA